MTLDCRYVKQYHEVGVAVPREAIAARDAAAIAQGLHARAQPPLRLFAGARKRRDRDHQRPRAGHRRDRQAAASRGGLVDGGCAAAALKGRRDAYVPEDNAFRSVPVYDGHRLRCGQRIAGPAIIEQVTTAVVLTGTWDAIVDKFGSFVLYRKGREDLVAGVLARATRRRSPA